MSMSTVLTRQGWALVNILDACPSRLFSFRQLLLRASDVSLSMDTKG